MLSSRISLHIFLSYMSAAVASVLWVDDYINANVTVTQGVQSALEAAVRSAKIEATTLRFSAREYRFKSTSEHVLALEGNMGHTLRIDGGGANLVITTPTSGLLRFTAAHGVIIGNFTVDMDPLPITQGRVIAVQSDVRYTLQLDDGFPSLTLPYFQSRLKWAIVKDPTEPTRHKVGTRNVVNVASWVDRGNRTFDITLETPNGVGAQVGDPVVHLARHNDGSTFDVYKSDNITFEDITVHASAGGSWVVLQSSGLVVRRVRVEPLLGRFHCTNADGVFVVDARVGPVIEDSTFKALGDDGFILKTFRGSCTRQRGASYSLSGIPAPLPSDVLWAWDPQSISGFSATSARVVSVVGSQGAKNSTVTFADPLPGIACKPGLQWVNDNATGLGFFYRNNTIQSRRYGILCMARGGVIEGNRFVDNRDSALQMMNADDVGEGRAGWMPRDIVVHGNTFTRNTRCAPGPSQIQSAVDSVISTAVVGPRSAIPPFRLLNAQGIRNISIERNVIDTWYYGAAIGVGNAVAMDIGRNTIFGPPNFTTPAVFVSRASGISVRDNALKGGWHSLDVAIQVDESASNVTATDNTLIHGRDRSVLKLVTAFV